MDLSSWSQRKIQQIATGFTTGSKNLYDFLAEVLEGEAGDRYRFASHDDIDVLEKSFCETSGSTAHRMTSDALFAQFIPYFEAGFFIKRGEGGEWRLSRMFILGQAFAQEASGTAPDFPMPEMSRLQVMETRGWVVLKCFNLERLMRLRDSVAFLHKITDDDAFLFVTERGRPWAVDRVEAANRVIARWAGAPSPPPVSTRGRLF